MPRPNKARCDICAHHEPALDYGDTHVECRLMPPDQGASPDHRVSTEVSRKLVPVDYWCGQFKRPRSTKA